MNLVHTLPPLSLKSILILLFNLLLGLSSGLRPKLCKHFSSLLTLLPVPPNQNTQVYHTEFRIRKKRVLVIHDLVKYIFLTMTIMKDGFGRTWKDAVMTCSKVLSQYLPEETGENHEQPQNSWPSGRESNPGLLKYKRMLITRTKLSVYACRFTGWNQVRLLSVNPTVPHDGWFCQHC
jgi:hypothetical protein